MSLIQCLSIVYLSVAPPGIEVQFAERPSATRQNAQVATSFALSQAADVEIAVLDAGGRVVRHLAAGVLGGEKLPPPPLHPGLKQSLVWDGRDDLGRLYIPNAITFTVSVRDNAGNPIVRFGGYGNYDCQGPTGTEPMPAIPLGWPVTAGASDRHIYIGDCLNHRIVRVDKKFAVEAEAALTRD